MRLWRIPKRTCRIIDRRGGKRYYEIIMIYGREDNIR